ncbi:MAG: purine-nucleoside phosphorylase [Gemmataceae bacterium]|nr:purine-nucleoside phosphorylase [Gemmataceae bacterium]
MPAFASFLETARALTPRTAVILGSGLANAAAFFAERASVGYSDVPGLVPATVPGHGSRLTVGEWAGTPALLFRGRLHLYEGHPRAVVTGLVRVAADLGARRLILTNAAGGIHPSLRPGDVMAIRAHLTLLSPTDWRTLARDNGLSQLYSPGLLDVMIRHEAGAGRQLLAGVYAALTGPSYETPAEIRALRVVGADAVGMSTALEAEEAVRRGLEVAAISCVTNKAAGLGDSALDHAEVLANAGLAVERVGELVGRLVVA